MKRLLLFTLIIFNIISANAQVGVSGGLNMLKAFGVQKPYAGMHLGVEIARDDEVTFYGRISTYLPNSDPDNGDLNYVYAQARDYSTVPFNIEVPYKSTINYTVLEGGSRYYIGEGYDSGFGAYGGSCFSLSFNSVKRKYDSFDETKYEFVTYEEPKGSIFNIGVGLSGGIKNTFPGIGTLYLDMNFSYLLLSQPSNTTAASTSLYSPLLFNFTLGFRKDLYR